MDPIFAWGLAGAVMIAAEACGVSGIGLFFAGLASFCVAVLISAGVILPAAFEVQLIWAFALTALWAAILWKPLQRMLHPKVTSPVPDLVGDTAMLLAPLKKGDTAPASWSGTRMNAKLADSEPEAELPIDTRVRIVDVIGNTLMVKQDL